MKKAKRSKLDIYYGMLNAIDSYGGTGRVTHISYASNTPLDRTKKYLEVLTNAGLLEAHVAEEGTDYVMTPRAYDFLRAYALVNSLVEETSRPVSKPQIGETERTLAAIMFTDIVGFTALSQRNEPLALELLEEHRGLIRPLFPVHSGTEVKTIGDAFLVEFRSALGAVLCAIEIQDRIKTRNSRSAPERKLELRVGIHLGEVVHGSGDIYGDAVNIASRIVPLAEPNEVCISQQVYDHVRNRNDLSITKVGELNLKNVRLPLGIYRVFRSA